MTEKPTETGRKPKGGRPTKEALVRRAARDAGIDPALVDPRWILAAIAADTGAPASARVAAAKALLVAGAGLPPETPSDFVNNRDEDEGDDALTRRALEIMARGGRPN